MSGFNITIFAKKLTDRDRKYIGNKIEANFVKIGDNNKIPDDAREKYHKWAEWAREFSDGSRGSIKLTEAQFKHLETDEFFADILRETKSVKVEQ